MISGEFLDALDRNERGIVEVVDDDGGVAAEEKLEHRVASDVTSTAGHQNVPHCPRVYEERKKEESKEKLLWKYQTLLVLGIKGETEKRLRVYTWLFCFLCYSFKTCN